MNWCIFILSLMLFKDVYMGKGRGCCGEGRSLSMWQGSWSIFPTSATWPVRTKIPMTAEFADMEARGRGKKKYKKKFRKFLLPLLLAYKLKFFTLIPVLIGMLVLLTGATGLAGFFFALFAAVMGLKTHSGH